MQATVNFTHNNARRGESHNDPSHHTARLFKRFGRRVPTLLPALLICLLAPLGQGMTSAQMSHSTNAAAPSEAQKAFEKMKAMVGSWQGSIMGISVNITIRVTSSGNAILHEATGDARPDDPITMFYLDGDRLLLTHFCDSGNRPRMEGKMSPDGKTVEFTLVDIAGNTQRGYMNQMAFTIIDANHHIEASTWTLPGNKSFQARGELTRTK